MFTSLVLPPHYVNFRGCQRGTEDWALIIKCLTQEIVSLSHSPISQFLTIFVPKQPQKSMGTIREYWEIQ